MRLAVFDMDGVLVDTWSSWDYVHRALGTSAEEARHAFFLGEITYEEFVRRDVEAWLKRHPDLTVERVREILSTVPHMRGIGEMTSALREMGYTLVIVSGGIDLLAEMLAKRYGFEEYYANGFEIRDGEVIPRVRVPVPVKGDVMRDLIRRYRPGEIVAVGDSDVDVDMFQHAHLRIAFNPCSLELEDMADYVIHEKDLRLIVPLLQYVGSSI